jgi:hypothetical protein
MKETLHTAETVYLMSDGSLKANREAVVVTATFWNKKENRVDIALLNTKAAAGTKAEQITNHTIVRSANEFGVEGKVIGLEFDSCNTNTVTRFLFCILIFGKRSRTQTDNTHVDCASCRGKLGV